MNNARRFLRNLNFTVGFILSVVVILSAVTSLIWTPYDGNKMHAKERLQGPSWHHPLGTDQYGRDTLSRVMKGAVNSIIVGLITVAIGVSIGVIIGLASAYYGKMIDEVLMRLCDLLFAFPAVLTAILITSILHPSIVNAMLAWNFLYSGICATHTSHGFIHFSPRIHYCRPGHRCGRIGDYLSACASQYSLSADHTGNHTIRRGDPGRSRAQLSGPGHSAAESILGPDVE